MPYWTLFAAAGALGFAITLTFVWHDMETRRPGTVLRHTVWLLTAALCAAAVLGRNGVDMSTVTAAMFVVAPGLIAVAALVTFLLREPKSRSALLTAFLVYGGLTILSAIVHSQIAPVLAKSAGLLYLPGLAVIAWCSRAKPPEMIALVQRVSLVVVYASLVLVAISPDWAGRDILPRRIPLPGIDLRIAGVTPHPNLLTIVAGLALILVVRYRGKRWLLHAAAAVSCIVLGETRNIALGVGIAVIVMWLVAGRSVPGRIFVGTPLLAVAASSLAAFNVDSALDDDVATFNSRTVIWEVAARYVPDKPVLGWGPFAFDRSVPTPLSAVYGVTELQFQHAHNQVIQVAVDAGLIGLTAFAVLAVLLVRMSFRAPREPALCAVTALVVVYSLTEVPFTVHSYGPSFGVTTLALMLTLWAAFDRQQQIHATPLDDGHRDPRPRRPGDRAHPAERARDGGGVPHEVPGAPRPGRGGGSALR